ncbi:hypothetical protein BCR33DRAFT_846163 [Rhizoclosmatium globosum]|uniref:Coiled-coil domain-containing protein 43 n=1 Tax=Rhizoclosmatium globosum TaxID=329046 RepID=A0A1Y2CWC8_9FUNG|nr:hypothetical protein BCR33DRAFT_846163 [Rhizoclosmatium globosum]|eukprot:ORY51341.1 hypothetical protein BCR33DRAFT_846163 [Rhizoclosmatium globosum]
MELVSSTLLREFNLSDEAYVEYVFQLSEDDTIESSEKEAIVVEFLSEAVEGESSERIGPVISALFAALQAQKADADAEAQAQAAKEKAALAQQLSEATLADNSDNSAADAQLPQKKVLSKEEKKARERLLRMYGYEVDEVVENENGETEILYSGNKEDKASMPDALMNTNVQRVKEAEQLRRQKMQAAHSAEVERNKAARQKQLDDAEKKKKKTVKQEKRRM